VSWNIEGKIGVKKSFCILLLAGIIQSCLISNPVPFSNSTSNNANRYEKEVKSSTIAYQNRDDKTQLLTKFSKKEIEPIVESVALHSGTATQIAKSITRDLSTDWEKAWVIFRWISENIDYDVAAYNAGRFYDTACSVSLKRGKAVCGGYARLLEEMYEAVGIPCFTISGYARGAGFTPGESTRSNHAWNAAKIGGKWYLMDATWGSGSIDSETKLFKRKFKEFYFAAVPSELILTHFPDNDRYQFLEKPITKSEYSDKPLFNNNLHEFGIIPDSRLRLTMKSSGKSEYHFRHSNKESNLLVSAVHEKSGLKIDGLVELRDFTSKVLLHFPQKGRYVVTVYAGPFTLKSFPSVINWYEDVSGTAPELPQTFNHFKQKQVQITSPLQKKLSPKKVYDFELNCPDAIEVALVINSNSKWLHLKKEGDRFYGKHIGEAYTVFAKYSENSKYVGLLEYEKE
jgi:hypothetical protein